MSDPIEALRDFIAESVRAELAKLAAPKQDEYLSTKKAAELANVATGTIRRWVKAGRLSNNRAGRLVRVSRADLERMLRNPPLNDSATPEQLARRKRG